MGWIRPITAALLLTSVVLAGCSGSGDKKSEDDFDDFGVQATDKTGVIIGVVVDATIQPIKGVKVVLSGGPTAGNTTTDDLGRFAFGDLEPGTYFVKANKLGFFEAQQSVDVQAGVANPEKLVIRLEADVANKPYFDEFVFEGFIECSGTFVAVGFAACSAPNIVTEITCEETGVCTGNLTNDNFLVRYPTAGTPTFAQSEMVWQSTQAAGGKMALMYSWDGGCDPYLCDHTSAGTSPILLKANETVLSEMNLDETNELMLRVFNRGLDETDPCFPEPAGCTPGGGLGFTFEQSFTVYTHVFYGYEPPEEWRFTENDEVPGPE